MALKEQKEENLSGPEVVSQTESLEGLIAEHAALDKEIQALEDIRFPSPEEEQHVKTLKIQKLALKTRIEHLQAEG